MQETSSPFFLITAEYVARRPTAKSGLVEEPGILLVLRNCKTLAKIYYFMPLDKIPKPCLYVAGIKNKTECLWAYKQFKLGVNLSSLSTDGNFTQQQALEWLYDPSNKDAANTTKQDLINVRRIKPYVEEGPPHFLWNTPTYKFSFEYPAQLAAFTKILKKKRIVSLEADMSRSSKFPLKVLIDYGIKSGVNIPSLEPFEAEERKYRTWFLDIETLAGWGKVSVEKGSEPIIVIGFYDNYDKKYYMLYWMEYNRTLNWTPPADAVLIRCRTEQEMLEKFNDMAREKDPDIITAYNLYGFDFPKLMSQMDRYRINKNNFAHPATQCRAASNQMSVYKTEGGLYKVMGRVLFDMLVGYKDLSGGELKEYTLEYVIKEEKLPVEKIQVDLSFLETWKQCPEVIFHRNYNDQKAMVLLEEKCGVIEYYEEISKFVGLPLDRCISPLKLQRKSVIDTQMLRQFHGQCVFPSEREFMKDIRYTQDPKQTFDFEPSKKSFPGATVLDPKANIWDWVFVYDFKEMYPSIIYAFNISPDTLSPEGNMAIDEKHKFLEKTVREGTMPQVIKYFRKKRNEYKQMAKDAPNEAIKTKFARREKSVKACTNACYGVMDLDSFRLCRRNNEGENEVTSSITMVGRELIAYIGKRAAEDECGLTIIYGDTDSVFVHFPATIDNYQEVAEMLHKKVSGYLEDWEKIRGLAPGNFRIDLDKIFKRMWLRETKKRYVGEMIFKDKVLDPIERKVVGWGRSDVSVVQEKIFDLLTEKQFDGKDTMAEIGELLMQVRTGKIPLLDIAATKSLSSDLVKKASAVKHHAKVGTFEILNYGKLKCTPKNMGKIATTKGQIDVDIEEKIDTVPSHVKAILYSNRYLGTYYDSGMKVYIIKINPDILASIRNPKYPPETTFKFHMHYNEDVKKKVAPKVDADGTTYEDKEPQAVISKKKKKGKKLPAFTPHPVPLTFRAQAIAFDPWTELPEDIKKAIDWEQEYQDLHTLLCEWLKADKLGLPVEALDKPKPSKKIARAEALAKIRKNKEEAKLSVFKMGIKPPKEQTSFAWARDD